jgi:hypothetical protein
MIVGIRHGVTPAPQSDGYIDYLDETGVPGYRTTERNRGVRSAPARRPGIYETFWAARLLYRV